MCIAERNIVLGFESGPTSVYSIDVYRQTDTAAVIGFPGGSEAQSGEIILNGP